MEIAPSASTYESGTYVCIANLQFHRRLLGHPLNVRRTCQNIHNDYVSRKRM
jgi:hypothetical protein